MDILRNRKKLDNKGFTLIELLAVVVILAVILGIAANSILSSVGKSRGGALYDSAVIVSQAFQTKYIESASESVANIYGNYDGFAGYDFTDNYIGYLDSSLSDDFNLSKDIYSLGLESDTLGTADVDKSIVGFNVATGKFVVCLVANRSGSYYNASYSIGNSQNNSTIDKVIINGTTYSFKTGEMFACSDGTKSWE